MPTESGLESDDAASDKKELPEAYWGEKDDVEDGIYCTENWVEETDLDEGTVDLHPYAVSITMYTHTGDVDWEDDESDAGARCEQEFEIEA